MEQLLKQKISDDEYEGIETLMIKNGWGIEELINVHKSSKIDRHILYYITIPYSKLIKRYGISDN